MGLFIDFYSILYSSIIPGHSAARTYGQYKTTKVIGKMTLDQLPKLRLLSLSHVALDLEVADGQFEVGFGTFLSRPNG